MSEEEILQFFKKCVHKKIRKVGWDEGTFFIPRELHGDNMVGDAYIEYKPVVYQISYEIDKNWVLVDLDRKLYCNRCECGAVYTKNPTFHAIYCPRYTKRR